MEDSGGVEGGTGKSLDAERVWKAFGALATYPAFHERPASLKLLRYLIEEELEGRGERIKTYAIALDVFGKQPSFDPDLNSMVRKEFRQLRFILDSYYAQHPGSEARLVLDKGRYRVSLRRCGDAPAQGEADLPPQAEAPVPAPASIMRRRWKVWAFPALAGLVALAGWLIWRPSTPMACARYLPTIMVAGGNAGASADNALLRNELEFALRQYSNVTVLDGQDSKDCGGAKPDFVLHVDVSAGRPASVTTTLEDRGDNSTRKFVDQAQDSTAPATEVISARIADRLLGEDGILSGLALKQSGLPPKRARDYRCLLDNLLVSTGAPVDSDLVAKATKCAEQFIANNPSANGAMSGVSSRIRLLQLVGIRPAPGKTNDQLRSEFVEYYTRSRNADPFNLEFQRSQMFLCSFSGNRNIAPLLIEPEVRADLGLDRIAFNCRSRSEQAVQRFRLNARFLDSAARTMVVMFGDIDQAAALADSARSFAANPPRRISLVEDMRSLTAGDAEALRRSATPQAIAGMLPYECFTVLAAASQLGDHALATHAIARMRAMRGMETYEDAVRMVDKGVVSPAYGKLFREGIAFGFAPEREEQPAAPRRQLP